MTSSSGLVTPSAHSACETTAVHAPQNKSKYSATAEAALWPGPNEPDAFACACACVTKTLNHKYVRAVAHERTHFIISKMNEPVCVSVATGMRYSGARAVCYSFARELCGSHRSMCAACDEELCRESISHGAAHTCIYLYVALESGRSGATRNWHACDVPPGDQRRVRHAVVNGRSSRGLSFKLLRMC